MIISVSRRTDIPCFYSQWFFNRLEEGHVYVRNPFNRKKISNIKLNPQDVDCFVFWSKDPEPMIKNLHKLKDYNYYFQFTLTPYDKDIEVNLRDKKEILNTFKRLSNMIGTHRVIWRYDPILINEKYSVDFHVNAFESMAKELSGYTDECIISFVQSYKNIRKNAQNLNLRGLTIEDKNSLVWNMKIIAQKYNIHIKSCCEDIYNDKIEKAACIDPVLIEKLVGKRIKRLKDKNQRKNCGCVKSIDIGEYNTCINNCLYCYANYNYKQVKRNFNKHIIDSYVITGKIKEDEKVYDRKVESMIEDKLDTIQFSFWDKY